MMSHFILALNEEVQDILTDRVEVLIQEFVHLSHKLLDSIQQWTEKCKQTLKKKGTWYVTLPA